MTQTGWHGPGCIISGETKLDWGSHIRELQTPDLTALTHLLKPKLEDVQLELNKLRKYLYVISNYIIENTTNRK